MKQGLKVLGVISLLKLIIFSEFSVLTRLSLAEPTPTVTPTQSQADEENLPPPEITLELQPETPINSRNETLFIVGLTVGRSNVNSGVLVRGEVGDSEAINFANWRVPYDAVLQALKFTSTVVAEDEVELKSPFKVVQLNLNDLQSDPELGLVLSVAEMRDIFGITIEFDWREYAIVFEVPEVQSPLVNRREKPPVVLEGLPEVSASNFSIGMVEQRVNLTGTEITDVNNRGNLSAVGTLFDSSWFLRLNQGDLTESETWQLSELQFLKQTDRSDYYLGSQPTFWRSQSGGDFWGFTTIQRQGYSPFQTWGINGANPNQRLQPEGVTATVTGRAEPGTLVQLVKHFYSGEVVAEQLVDSSGVYRFDNVTVGRYLGGNYYVLLYPDGSLAAEPIIEEARFTLLPEQLPAGTSALVVAGGWKRRLNLNNFVGEFTEFNAGVSQRWGISQYLTLGLGAVYDSSLNGLAEVYYQPKGTPFRASISGLIGEDIDVNANLVWDGYPNFMATLSSDLDTTRYSVDWQAFPRFRFTSNGTFDQRSNFGVQYFFSGANYSTLTRVNIDTEGRLSWGLNQRLGKFYLIHRGNDTSTLFDLSYRFNPYNYGVLNYNRFNSSTDNHLLSTFWRYRSPDRTQFGESLWQTELGYRVGSQGNGIYATAATTILPGILLEGRYEEVSLTSDESRFSLQLVSSLGLQQGISPGDRRLAELRTEGGLLVQPFYDLNSNGERDKNEEIYTDTSEFMIVNNEFVKPWEIQVKSDRFLMRLPPGTYRLDLEAAGFPPDFQPSVNTFAVEVVEGSYTPIMVPLQPSYTIAGVVTDAEGKPIAGARVEAFSRDGSSASLSITNTAGVYYLEQLREGTYQLKLNRKTAIEPNTITIEANSETLLEINLTRN